MSLEHASRVLGIHVYVTVTAYLPLVELELTMQDYSLTRVGHSPSTTEVPDTVVVKAAEWWF